MILKAKVFKTDKELGNWLIHKDVKIISIERYSAIEACELPCGAILLGHGGRIKVWYLILKSSNKSSTSNEPSKDWFNDLFRKTF